MHVESYRKTGILRYVPVRLLFYILINNILTTFYILLTMERVLYISIFLNIIPKPIEKKHRSQMGKTRYKIENVLKIVNSLYKK